MLDATLHPTQSVRFEVHADADPGLLPRLLNPLARRDLTPDLVRARRYGETVVATLELHAMPSEMLHLVEGNLRQVVGVRAVSTELRARLRAVA
jgi:hypothetical protein